MDAAELFSTPTSSYIVGNKSTGIHSTRVLGSSSNPLSDLTNGTWISRFYKRNIFKTNIFD